MHKNHTLGSFLAFFPVKTRPARMASVLLFLIAMPLYAAELNVAGEIQTTSMTVTGLDCTGNANGGTLTANASGVVSCADDDIGTGDNLGNHTATQNLVHTESNGSTGLEAIDDAAIDGESATLRDEASASVPLLVTYIEALQAQNRALDRRLAALERRLN